VLFVFPSGLSAHPHVFITQSIQIVFNDKGLAGFKVRWQFDDMFSAMIAGDYDKNENGRLEAAEKKAIRKEAFEPLAEHNYFTFIKIDGKSFQVQYIKDFEARLENKRLQYRFLIPCHVTAISHSKKLTVATYDSTYYGHSVCR